MNTPSEYAHPSRPGPRRRSPDPLPEQSAAVGYPRKNNDHRGASPSDAPGRRACAPSNPDDSAELAGAVQLLRPAQAAARLAVPESWLRRRAGLRLIPATYLGRHLRFSEADVAAIAAAAARPPRPLAPARRRR